MPGHNHASTASPSPPGPDSGEAAQPEGGPGSQNAAALAEQELGRLSEAFDAWRQDPETAQLYLEYIVYDAQGREILVNGRNGKDQTMLKHILHEIRWMIAYRHKTLAPPTAGANPRGCHLLFTVQPDEWQALAPGVKPAAVSVWLVGRRRAGFPVRRLGIAPAGIDPGAWADQAVLYWTSKALRTGSADPPPPPSRDNVRFQLQIELAASPRLRCHDTHAGRLRRRVREVWTEDFGGANGRADA